MVAFKLLCIVLFVTGLRINEALKLTREELCKLVDGESVKLFIQKTQSDRSLRLTTGERILWLDHVPRDYLDENGLNNGKGETLCRRTASRWLEPIFEQQHEQFVEGKEVRNPGLSFGTHSFRVGYINRYASNFKNPGDVQSRIGHKNVGSTMKYIRGRDNDELTELANKAGM